MSSPYRHIVLFRVHDDVGDDAVNAAVAALGQAGNAEGVLEGRIATSDDRRKARVIVENGLFEDRDAFNRWQASSLHKRTTEGLAGITDWWIGDYEEELRP